MLKLFVLNCRQSPSRLLLTVILTLKWYRALFLLCIFLFRIYLIRVRRQQRHVNGHLCNCFLLVTTARAIRSTRYKTNFFKSGMAFSLRSTLDFFFFLGFRERRKNAKAPLGSVLLGWGGMLQTWTVSWGFSLFEYLYGRTP